MNLLAIVLFLVSTINVSTHEEFHGTIKKINIEYSNYFSSPGPFSGLENVDAQEQRIFCDKRHGGTSLGVTSKSSTGDSDSLVFILFTCDNILEKGCLSYKDFVWVNEKSLFLKAVDTQPTGISTNARFDHFIEFDHENNKISFYISDKIDKIEVANILWD